MGHNILITIKMIQNSQILNAFHCTQCFVSQSCHLINKTNPFPRSIFKFYLFYQTTAAKKESQVNMENNEGNAECNEFSLTRPSLGSEVEYDDELGVPGSLKIVDIGDGPIVIEHSDEEIADCTISGLAFSNVHKSPVKFKSFHRDVFIPGLEITATITDYERNLTTHMLNPNLYTISFTHGNFTWQMKKRYKQIHYLHQQLIMFRASLNIPFPSKIHRRKRESFKLNVPEPAKGKKRGALPRFPKKPEILIGYERLRNRMKQLENYLNNLLSINIYRNHPATIEFLEVSNLSFNQDLGIKGKEGMVKKRTGSTQPGQAGCNCFGLIRCFFCIRCQHLCNDILCARWVERWFFIKDTCFGYINPSDGRIKCVILYDQGFEVASGMYSIGLQTGFHIMTLSRQIAFKCWTRRKGKEWIDALKEVAVTTARDFTQPNQHHSFAPIRTTVQACWFVDGSSYMSTVADAIENSKEEIFITDWWLSPEIYLKRPVILGDYWRLDKLLQRKANSGVKIFILLYKELEMALGLNSYYSKQKLVGSHENIKVLRHPDHAKAGVFLWAHHEKIVVVDQTYAFIGGLDLCYGRWDDSNHRLTDLGSISPCVDVSTLKKKSSSIPGGDSIYPIPIPIYKQTPIPEIHESQTPTDEESSSLTQLEPGDNLLMPNSTPEKMKCNTPDMERKNVIVTIKNTVKNKSKDLISLVYTPHEDNIYSPDDNENTKATHNQTPDELIESLDGSSKFWVGKDYVNFIVKDFNNLDLPYDDFIDRATTPRMPWHDVGVCVQGAAARDISRHFIQRWNAIKLEKAKSNISYPYLLPKSYDEFKTLPIILPNENHQVTCQVLRSVSTWSCGFLEPDTVEQSIHEAYIDSINRAQHYIYIENQFFISLPYSNPNTRNQIAEALYKRIIRAHKAKEIFRVYVVMPLLPGFEGEVGGPTGTSLHAITHWNYASISQGKDAILNRLLESGVENPTDYISFYGLRNHAKLNCEPITELIYVHSKLMIIDDKLVICGSANINDRSLIGKRDSEIAVLIEDESFDDGVMNGRSFPCGKFAGTLRKYLFKEHLGLLGKEHEMIDFDISDPISDYFYKDIWYKTASWNSEFFEKIFHCIPTDTVQSFSDLKKFQEEKPLYISEISRAEKMLESIQGHLVLLPLNFLSKENLTPAVSSVEGMMPTSLWT